MCLNEIWWADAAGVARGRPTDASALTTHIQTYVITYDAVQHERPHFGARVRSLREAMDLSLRDLAERSGVSAPMLSQVERGETSPTLAVADRIAGGLELTLSQLLRLDEGGRRERGPGGASAAAAAAPRGHRYEVLTPPLPGQRAEVSLHTLAPGASTGGPGDPPMHEPGSRETAVVVDGAPALRLRRRRPRPRRRATP